MAIHVKHGVLLLWLFCIPVKSVCAQPHSSRNNYTGNWETPASWDPTWNTPATTISGYNITINGFITLNKTLNFTGASGNLIVNDTLVINGDLILDNNNNLTVNDNAILIIRGNLTIGNQTVITGNAYLIVTGNLVKNSSVNQGSFTSNDNPYKFFIGGTISSVGLINNPNYPVLNCTESANTIYPNTGCSYGNLVDLSHDPIYAFFQSTCAKVITNSNSPVCAGDMINLSSSGGKSYNWTGPNGFTSNAQDPSIPKVSTAMAGVYSVNVTANGCTVTDTINVIVNALPAVNAGTDKTIPNGTNTTIDATVTGTGPFTYSWTPPSHLVNAFIEDPTTLNLGTTTLYTLTATSTTTSCSNTDEVEITISGGPLSATSTANPGTTCAGDAVQLNSLAGGGSGSYTYSWTSTPVGFTSAMDNPIAYPTENTTYNVAVFDGFTIVNSQVTVTVNALPATPTVTASGPLIFCADSSVTLTSSAGTNYFWSNLATTANINVAASGSYSVRVTNASGCQSAPSAATVAVVNDLPAVPTITASGPLTFCADSSITLTSSAGTGYLWSNIATTANIKVAASGSYSVRVTNSSGCQSAPSAATTVVVNALPLVNITSNNIPLCMGDVRTLTASPVGGTFAVTDGPGSISGNILSASGSGTIDIIYTYTDVCTGSAKQAIPVNESPVANAGPDQQLTFAFETQMQALIAPGDTGEWQLIAGTGQVSDVHSAVTRITDLSIGDNIFRWNVRNSGCTASAEVQITVLDLNVPSVITPNGDGKNDYFVLPDFEGKAGIIIFNQWGIEVYSNANYSNDWDGRNNKGIMLPDDTYFYVLKFENGRIKKGSVLIKR